MLDEQARRWLLQQQYSRRQDQSLDELGRNHRRCHVQVPQNPGTMKSMARVWLAVAGSLW
jgi:hypothetical protein